MNRRHRVIEESRSKKKIVIKVLLTKELLPKWYATDGYVYRSWGDRVGKWHDKKPILLRCEKSSRKPTP